MSRKNCFVLLTMLLGLSACGGGGSSAPPTYTVGGTVSGLGASKSVVLQNNGGDNLTVSANGTFTFSTRLANSAAYAVTVLTQPASQTCTVSNGSGSISGANIANVSVACVTPTYTVSVTVSGLGASKSVVLQNNGGDNLTVSADGTFTFSLPVDNGTAYDVRVFTQPSLQTCTIANASGTISGADITNVAVTCVVSVALPKTGQTTCYDNSSPIPAAVACAGTGQDGEFQKGAVVTSRFVAGSGATAACVTDSLTGLMWVAAPSTTGDTWANALTYVNGLNLCGFTDWRLPNRVEMDSLLNFGVTDNSAVLNAAGFSNIGAWYWSSTTLAGNPTNVGVTYIVSGLMTTSAVKTYTYPRIWPVRGP